MPHAAVDLLSHFARPCATLLFSGKKSNVTRRVFHVAAVMIAPVHQRKPVYLFVLAAAVSLVFLLFNRCTARLPLRFRALSLALFLRHAQSETRET